MNSYLCTFYDGYVCINCSRISITPVAIEVKCPLMEKIVVKYSDMVKIEAKVRGIMPHVKFTFTDKGKQAVYSALTFCAGKIAAEIAYYGLRIERIEHGNPLKFW